MLIPLAKRNIIINAFSLESDCFANKSSKIIQKNTLPLFDFFSWMKLNFNTSLENKQKTATNLLKAFDVKQLLQVKFFMQESRNWENFQITGTL